MTSPLALDEASLGHFIDQCHRRRHPTRSDIFRPGDTANTLYYVVSGSLSIISVEGDGRELVLGYVNAGEFVGEMGLFVSANVRAGAIAHAHALRAGRAQLRARAPAVPDHAFGRVPAASCTRSARSCPSACSTPAARPARLAFLDVTGRIIRTLDDLTREPDALSHPQGTQIRVSRQELARIVGCSREMAGRVLKQLQIDGKLHARGKTVVVYGTR